VSRRRAAGGMSGAEVKAIKEQQAKGATEVRCTHSRFLRTEVR